MGRLRPPDGLDGCAALLRYEDPARQLVARLKYGNARLTLRWLAEAMAPLLPPGTDVITWAPTTDRRRRARGFDQAELLARATARVAGLPHRGLLGRFPGPPQTGRSLEERGRGPRFWCPVPLDGPSVVVVDDVVTTGATLAAAGRVLRSAGAGSVHGLAAAHPL